VIAVAPRNVKILDSQLHSIADREGIPAEQRPEALRQLGRWLVAESGFKDLAGFDQAMVEACSGFLSKWRAEFDAKLEAAREKDRREEKERRAAIQKRGGVVRSETDPPVWKT
jgi:hypothetical protein